MRPPLRYLAPDAVGGAKNLTPETTLQDHHVTPAGSGSAAPTLQNQERGSAGQKQQGCPRWSGLWLVHAS
jgi:hypothetical protein